MLKSLPPKIYAQTRQLHTERDQFCIHHIWITHKNRIHIALYLPSATEKQSPCIRIESLMLWDHNRTKILEENTVIPTKSPRMRYICTRHTAKTHGITRLPELSRYGGAMPMTCGSLITFRIHVKVTSTKNIRADTTITYGKGPILYTSYMDNT